MNMIDAVINLLIFGITVFLIVRYTRESGKWDLERIRKTFRFYTCQSNALCAGAALLMALFRLAGNVPEWVWILKYIGTAAVTVTMLTVFLFLAPSVGKEWYGILLKGNSNLFMHLLTPLAALVSFCVLEKRGMTFPQSLWGMLPVVLYGPLYLYRILFARAEKRWDDFYGFNKAGKWRAAFAAMLAGTFAVCMGLMALQNI